MRIPHISIPRLGFNMVFKDPNLRFPTGAWRISGARSRLKEPFNCTASAASTTTGLKPCSRQREALLRWRFKETKPGFGMSKFCVRDIQPQKTQNLWILSRYFWGGLVLSCFVVWMFFWAGWGFSSYEHNCLQKGTWTLGLRLVCWKKAFLLSIKSWLFNRDPYFVVYEIIPA